MKQFIVSLVMVAIASAVICNCGNGSIGVQVVDGPSALKAHKEFLAKAARMKETDIRHLVALTKEWSVLSGKVACD